ncbi:MAG: hypothetical protein ABRQ37_27635 [Candidatus Eremiobacterota bacterium]
MKKVIFFLLFILLSLYPALSQSWRTVTINGEPINYILYDNQPYVNMIELKRLGFFGIVLDAFSHTTYVLYNDEYYYQLEACCKIVGLVSAEKTPKELKIKLYWARVLITVTKNHIERNVPGGLEVTIGYGDGGTAFNQLGFVIGEPTALMLYPDNNYFFYCKGFWVDNHTYYCWERHNVVIPPGETVQVILGEDYMTKHSPSLR